MRRVTSFILAVFFSATLLLSAVPINDSATAQEAPNHLWNGQLSFEDLGIVMESEVNSDSFCETQDITERAVVSPGDFSGSLGELLTLYSANITRENECIFRNSQGFFNDAGRYGRKLYSPTGASGKFMELESLPLSPAPAGSNVLLQSWSGAETRYRLYHTDTFRESTQLVRSGLKAVYRHNGVATQFKLSNGEDYTAKLHSFSPNGQYIAVHSGGWIHKVDLDSFTLTPVKYVGTRTRIASLSVTSDGRYILQQTSNAMTVIDSEGCENSYGFGAWQEQAVPGFSTTPGCVESGDLFAAAHTNGIIDIYSGGLNRQFQRAYFGPVSDTIIFAFGEKPSGAVEYSWREIKITADDYVSSAQGYLAMGDSFVSGEGDLQGDEWYEPGTDEQGDKATFAGRNLCHLSRRSYPYLMAVELGYLASPSTPPADGLFHSVACSGAKIHNIVGGGDNGLVEYDADEAEFAEADNQYRLIESSNTLEGEQPGYRKQLDFLNFEKLETFERTEKSPEIITLSIGGNDVGFGSNLTSCILSAGTCAQAQAGSFEQEVLIREIALLKYDLRRTYDQVRENSPESRVYVTGYPVFVDDQATLGVCNENVKLNLDERRFMVEAVKYLNTIVEAAANEAGVVYVDIEDILAGTNLCSGADRDAIVFNGVTLGDDKFGLLGNETYHPNDKAHVLYKNRILNQTSNLTLPMSDPQPYVETVPLPSSDYFDQSIIDTVYEIGRVEIVEVSAAYEIIVDESVVLVDEARVIKRNLLPGAEVLIEQRSTPIELGRFIADANGVLDVIIPLSTEAGPGSHTIHLYSIDQYGAPIHNYQPIFVAYADNDYDGDGVLNENDSCKIISNSGEDEDGDGVDDACDNDVVPPPDPPKPEHPVCKILRRLERRLPRFLKPIIYRLYDRFDCRI